MLGPRTDKHTTALRLDGSSISQMNHHLPCSTCGRYERLGCRESLDAVRQNEGVGSSSVLSSFFFAAVLLSVFLAVISPYISCLSLIIHYHHDH